MGRIAFTNANLLDGERPARPSQTIIVEHDRLAFVGDDAAARLNPDDQQIALHGRTLMPGMFQSHWHGSYKGLDFKCLPVGLEQPPGYLMLLAATQAKLAMGLWFYQRYRRSHRRCAGCPTENGHCGRGRGRPPYLCLGALAHHHRGIPTIYRNTPGGASLAWAHNGFVTAPMSFAKACAEKSLKGQR